MKRTLDKPTNWQDFEDLCFILWKFIWNDPHAQKNGRQGQAQYGVDIYGKPVGQLDIEGVQCKGKSDYSKSELTITEIKAELTKAINFKPTLKNLTFATTAPSDANLLKEIRALDIKGYGNIVPHVRSWDELDLEIRQHEEVLKAFYSDSIT